MSLTSAGGACEGSRRLTPHFLLELTFLRFEGIQHFVLVSSQSIGSNECMTSSRLISGSLRLAAGDINVWMNVQAGVDAEKKMEGTLEEKNTRRRRTSTRKNRVENSESKIG
uniref:Uncharacterized protein n=1 Tax=Guillardia theta TaxID=55529 RepID=A0A6U6DGM6_GUITH|mmetsp:Transcript_588/g.1509  ORF Transcript_588/g.1509 Transcript_588/m.1509 type:complete len:112 (+) Transcript_588:847-1182(+)